MTSEALANRHLSEFVPHFMYLEPLQPKDSGSTSGGDFTSFRTVLRSTCPHSECILDAVSQGVKQPEREVYHCF